MLDCLAGPFEPRCIVYELMPIFLAIKSYSLVKWNRLLTKPEETSRIWRIGFPLHT